MSVRVQFTAIRAGTKRLPTEAIQAELRTFTQRFLAEDLLLEVAPYPPPIEESDYVRTFRLLSNWRVRDISHGDSIGYRLQNSVQDPRGRYYARMVHGGPTGAGQLRVHADNGWTNMADALQRIGGRRRFRSQAQAIINRKLR